MLPLPSTAPSATEEAALVQRLLARDERALQTLYDRYAAGLLAVIRRVVGDGVLAQDVLQEGLLKIWRGVGRYNPERGRLFPWMARVCGNHAIDVLRTPRHQFHRGQRSLDASGAHQLPAPEAFNPEHVGVRELVVRLKPKQREVVELLYFGGCTQAEAAEELGVPLATVKTRARAALVALGGWVR